MKVVEETTGIRFFLRAPLGRLITVNVAAESGSVWRLVNSNFKPIAEFNSSGSNSAAGRPHNPAVRLSGPITIKRTSEASPEEIFGESPSTPDEEFATVVTYGIVPSGLHQQLPTEGSAPPLIAGTRYSVLALTGDSAERALFTKS